MKTRATLVCEAAVALSLLTFAACSTEDPGAEAGAGQAGAVGVAGKGGASSGGAGSGGASSGGAGSGGTSNGGAPSSAGQGGAVGGGSTGGGSTGGTAGASAGGTGGAAGGSSGAAGQAGAGGSAGAGGAGGTDPSMGCDKPTTQATNQWVESMVMTSGNNRPYSVRLPNKYDQKRAYPVVMLLHGCTAGNNNVPMENATGEDAILVRGTGSAANTCWNTSANGPDVAFFDAMVADVKSRFCADEKRVFIVGYSSGSWLVNQLTCIRADVVRGGASVSGGESAGNNCGGPVARIFLHDSTDNDNKIDGSIKARDRQLTQNGCNKSAAPTPVEPSPCTQYQGCMAGNPVHWCQTSGKGHGRQDAFAPSTFWNFFKAL